MGTTGKKALWISTTKLRGVWITCGGRVRDTDYKSFVTGKAQLAKGFSWTESDLMTQHNEGEHPEEPEELYAPLQEGNRKHAW